MVSASTASDNSPSEKAAAPSPDYARVFVEQVSIRNFRGIVDCVVSLEPGLTVLVGRNNCGKSRILRALAVGLGAAAPDKDDLTLSSSLDAEIDIVLAPLVDSGKEDAFDERSGTRLGTGVQSLSEDPVRERFAWRTVIKPSAEGFGVRSDSHVLIFNQNSEKWEAQSNAKSLSARQRSMVAADLVQTRRDLVEELTRRNSPINRVLGDLEVATEARESIEERLQDLGRDIVSSSESLQSLKESLGELAKIIDEIGVPGFEPLPIRLEELSRSVSINLDAGNGNLPLRFHGSGARSLASIQVQSVLYARRLGRDGPALLPHPVTLIEEPETHLHPQAQFELETLLTAIHGQAIVSTHSAHLVSVLPPEVLRLVQRKPSGVGIVDLKPVEDEGGKIERARRPRLHLEEMEKLRRFIERPFGELLFASAVVVGDGATERALLPPLIKHALETSAHGVCVVDPGSMADMGPAIIKFAKLVDLPWFLFSDSDDEGRLAATKLIAEHAPGEDDDRIIWVSGTSEGGKEGGATEKMLLDFDPSLCERAAAKLSYDGGDILKFMKKKGAIGRLLANELVALGPYPQGHDEQDKHWPSPINTLIRKLSVAIGSAEVSG